MTTAPEFLARGSCYYGHRIDGPFDLWRHDSGQVECVRCMLDMEAERANLRAAALRRAEQGRG